MKYRYLQLACFLVVGTCALSYATAQINVHRIDIGTGRVGSPPVNFEFLRTGEGTVGNWMVVPDATTAAKVSIEHLSDDKTEDRFSIAVYKPLSVKNLAVRARVKVIDGTMQSAGLAVRIQDRNNYYVVSTSTLERRIDLFRVVNGKSHRIAGIDADVAINRWHMIALVADEDRFTVAVDNKQLFSVSDPTFLTEGRVGLWAEEDNLARFDRVEIRALPRLEER